MSRYVLDTSAVLAVLNGEPGADTVVALLDEAAAGRATVHLPFMAWMELSYLSLRRRGVARTEEILRLVEAWPLQIAHSTPDWCSAAARVKARGSLSVADAWICSLATSMDAKLVHKDPEYDAVDGLLSVRL